MRGLSATHLADQIETNMTTHATKQTYAYAAFAGASVRACEDAYAWCGVAVPSVDHGSTTAHATFGMPTAQIDLQGGSGSSG